MKLINYSGNTKATGIYCIKNLVNNKIYIGSTKRSFATRKTRHLRLLRNNTHYNEHLQNAWNYYKEENFSFEVLYICLPNECEKYEGEFMKLYNSNKREFGYNIACVSTFCFDYKISENHNIEKSIRKRKKSIELNGLYTTERGIQKPFKLYDINGKFIKEYNSFKDFFSDNKGSKAHVSTILSNRKLLYKNNNIILFSNDNLSDEDILIAKNKIRNIKKIDLFDLNNNYIKTFNSAIECAKFIGCKDAEIRMCCTNRRSRIKNYVTKYKKNE